MMNFVSRSPLFVSVFAFLMASAAFAAPKVGDSATLEGKLTGNGMNMKIVTIQTITGYDVNTDVFTISQTQKVDGQTQTTEIQASSDDMVTEEMAATIVATCESGKIGKNEKVTVSAGTFKTCRVTNSEGAVLWVASVPFGVVKLTTLVGGGTVKLGAASFAHGQ